MKIGFGVPVSGSWATPGNLTHVAQRAEQLGYHSLWTYQRLLSPVDAAWGDMYRSVMDPVVALAYVAAQTSRIRLGVAVINMPFIAPVVVAKQLATLDIVSGGRVDAGFGNGWSDEEFAATGATKQGQGRRADEFLTLLRTLWTDEIVEHAGDFYQVPRMRLDPKPVQRPHPPILLGAVATPALRRVGRLCDGWVSRSRADLRTIGESVAVIRDAAEQAGRDPSALRFVCRGVARVRPAGRADRAPLTGSLDEIRTDVDDLAGQGITEVFFDLNFDPQVGSPDVDAAASLRRADEVLEALAPRN
jgi:probable F420-dependent oxidoreductase